MQNRRFVRDYVRKAKRFFKRNSYIGLIDSTCSNELRGDLRYLISKQVFESVWWLKACEQSFLEDLSTFIERQSFAPKEMIPSGPDVLNILMQVRSLARSFFTPPQPLPDLILPLTDPSLPLATPRDFTQGVASRAGAIIAFGGHWGDVILTSPILRDTRVAKALSYCEISKISRASLIEVSKSYPKSASIIRKSALKIAILRAMTIISMYARKHNDARTQRRKAMSAAAAEAARAAQARCMSTLASMMTPDSGPFAMDLASLPGGTYCSSPPSMPYGNAYTQPRNGAGALASPHATPSLGVGVHTPGRLNTPAGWSGTALMPATQQQQLAMQQMMAMNMTLMRQQGINIEPPPSPEEKLGLVSILTQMRALAGSHGEELAPAGTTVFGNEKSVTGIDSPRSESEEAADGAPHAPTPDSGQSGHSDRNMEGSQRRRERPDGIDESALVRQPVPAELPDSPYRVRRARPRQAMRDDDESTLAVSSGGVSAVKRIEQMMIAQHETQETVVELAAKTDEILRRLQRLDIVAESVAGINYTLKAAAKRNAESPRTRGALSAAARPKPPRSRPPARFDA